MSSSIHHFFLTFDHARDELDIEEFGDDAQAATSRYEDLEEQCRDSRTINIVLVGSDSIETVKVTHSTYFAGFQNASLDEGSLERMLASIQERMAALAEMCSRFSLICAGGAVARVLGFQRCQTLAVA